MINIGRFQIEGEIGRGGYGSVYKAKLVGPGGFVRDVAIKTFLNPLGTTSFLDEARLMARLQHENIVHIYDLISAGDTYFIVMEYVKGYDLDEVIKTLYEKSDVSKFNIEEIIYILKKILEALEYAHTLTDEKGNPLNIVHRDVSTKNVMITMSGGVKLMDFGIAKSAEKVHYTMPNVIKGNPNFMSPEHVVGNIDKRADIFSVGCIAYAILCGGKTPFAGSSLQETIKNLLHNDFTHLPQEAKPFFRDENMFEDFNSVLKKALQKKPEDRYQSAKDFIIELEKFKSKYSLISSEYEVKLLMKGKMEKLFSTERKFLSIDENNLPPSLYRLKSYEEKLKKEISPRTEQKSDVAATLEFSASPTSSRSKISKKKLIIIPSALIIVGISIFAFLYPILLQKIPVTLKINSLPPAKIYINDEFLGDTPILKRVKLKKGKNLVKLILANGKENIINFDVSQKGEIIPIIFYDEDEVDIIFEDEK
ncbi:MAG: serine/threonine-protein kinase [Candidatus Micrarchaeia archaeon]